MGVKISKHNTKLGIIPSVNLPPIVTCRRDAPCTKHCYAMRGRFRFSSNRECMQGNYNAYLQSKEKYFEEVGNFINNGLVSYSFFRWHAAGDIPDEAYFDGMVSLARKLPNTKFLAFTKKFELINEYISKGNTIPNNLKIVFSAWGERLRVDNPYGLPVAYVRFGDDAENVGIPADSQECGGDCSTCLKCWEVQNGQSVVFNQH